MNDDHAPSGIEEVTCHEFVGLVTDYWDDALAAQRLELVEEHLVMCDWCKTYLEQMRDTVGMLPSVPAAEPVPPSTERALLAAFEDWRENR
ncbi:MAG: anti-sigma factor family protein [Solirubrobacterales bacterium]